MIDARDVRVTYDFRGRTVEAVRGVSLKLSRGEHLGLIGESGSGKSSLGRALLGLEPQTTGTVTFDGQPVHNAAPSLRRRFQPVFQDVTGALDPRQRIRQALAEPFEIHRIPFTSDTLERALALTQLGPDLLDRFPHELSVGQQQRVNLARALSLDPELLVLDEPVSALDVSVQAQVVNLLLDLRERRALSWIVITHDLDVVAHLSSRLAVMHEGQLVEEGPTGTVLAHPQHPYTKHLLAHRSP